MNERLEQIIKSAILQNYPDGREIEEFYKKIFNITDSYFHIILSDLFENGYSILYPQKDGKIIILYKNGMVHSVNDEPAFYQEKGESCLQTWYKNGQIHRSSSKPAKFFESNQKVRKEYWMAGEFLWKNTELVGEINNEIQELRKQTQGSEEREEDREPSSVDRHSPGFLEIQQRILEMERAMANHGLGGERMDNESQIGCPIKGSMHSNADSSKHKKKDKSGSCNKSTHASGLNSEELFRILNSMGDRFANPRPEPQQVSGLYDEAMEVDVPDETEEEEEETEFIDHVDKIGDRERDNKESHEYKNELSMGERIKDLIKRKSKNE